MTEDEITIREMLQWINGQRLQKFNWLDDFGPNGKPGKRRGSLEVSQKQRDIVVLGAIEKELKLHVRTVEKANTCGTEAGAGNAGSSLSGMDQERPDRAGGGKAADSDAQGGFDGF